MRYFSVSCGNGYCGCDEEWLMEGEIEPESTDIIDCYTYESGAGGLRIGDDEDDDISEEEYYQNMMDNISIEEISEEEFINLRDNEYWEVR
jgi:hypothetical protein